MLPLGPLVALALGSLREHWRVTLALTLGAIVLSASLAAAPITQDLVRALALREALDGAPPGALEVRVSRDGLALDRVAYTQAQAALDDAIVDALGDAAASGERMGTTDVLELRAAPQDDEQFGEVRGTAVLRFRSGLEDRVALVEGRLPEALPRGLGDPIPVLLATSSAELVGLEVGQGAVLTSTGLSEATPPVPIVVVGLATPRDPADPYWGGRPELLERAPSGAIALLLPESSFFGAVPDLLRGATAQFESTFAVSPDALEAGDIAPLADRVRDLPRLLAALGGAEVESELPQALAGAGELEGFDRTALVLLYGQLAAAAALLVGGAAVALSARREPLRAGLRLHGAAPGQLAAIEAFAIVPVALVGLLAGPLLAALAVSALGRLDTFEPFADGGRLTVELGRDAYLFGAAGAAAVLAIGLVVGWGASFPRRAETARGAWIAVTAAAAGAGLIFWALTRNDRLFEPSAGNGVTTDYALLLAPLALLAPAALLARALLPLLARPLASLVAMGRGIALLGGLRAVARGPLGVAFPLVLLAAAAVVLLASVPATLERSPIERAAYAAGGDVRAAELAGSAQRGEAERRAAIEAAPLDAASPLARVDGALTSEAATVPTEILGIDPASFAAVASWRDDFATDSLPAILSALGANATTLDGIPIPANIRQIGAWLQLVDVAGEVGVALSLRNERGGYVQLLLGRTVPPRGGGTTWRFFAADLETAFDPDGAPIAREALEGRLTLHGYYLLLSEQAAAAAGVAQLGAVLASSDPPATSRDSVDRLISTGEAFARRAIVHDLGNREGLEPIAGIAPGGEPDRVRNTIASPSGFRGSQRIEWDAVADDAAAPPATIRGLRQETDGAPMLLYVSASALDRLKVAIGSDLELTVRGRVIRAQIAGALDQFPTLPADAAFAVGGLDRLAAAINASPTSEPLLTNEAWFASTTPTIDAAALRRPPLEAGLVVDRDSERAALGDARVTAFGWRAVLTIGFAALLVVAAAGVLLDLGERARRRDAEWAAIDALGGSPAGQLGALAWETAIRVGAAATIGAAAAVPLARWLLEILARDPAASVIVPPLRLTSDAGAPWLAAFMLGASFVVVMVAAGLRYKRSLRRPALAGGEA